MSHRAAVPHMHSLPHCQRSSPDDTFVAIDEPTLTHYNHPKSTVYITVHSWCFTFCGTHF